MEAAERHAALPRPPSPPPARLPGLWLPEAAALAHPAPPAAPRPPLDLALGPAIGRLTPEPEARIRGAEVGPDWRNAFRRWLDEHLRYPQAAALLGEQGTTRVALVVEPDGRVRSARLLRRSGSAWLDSGTLNLFRGATLPAFPPGADPAGVHVDLTVNYILVRE